MPIIRPAKTVQLIRSPCLEAGRCDKMNKSSMASKKTSVAMKSLRSGVMCRVWSQSDNLEFTSSFPRLLASRGYAG